MHHEGNALRLQSSQKQQPAAGDGKGRKQGWFDWYFNSRKQRPEASAPRTTPMRIEPKTFFANERTFLSWLHMAITVGSISAALLGFAGTATKTKTTGRVSCTCCLHHDSTNDLLPDGLPSGGGCMLQC